MSRKSSDKNIPKGDLAMSEEGRQDSVVASFMEQYSAVTQEAPGRDVFWARMSGFIPWPSRLCSAYEVKQLCDVKQPPKSKSFPVTFLGTRNERGWVPENNLTPFTPEALGSKLDKSKFKRDRDYRAAVVEAMLLTRSKGVDFGEDFEAMLEDSQPELKEYLSQTCPECAGSFLSGPFHVCTFCNEAMVHWHCFRCDDEHVGDKLWVCNPCRKTKRMKDNFILPSPEKVDGEESSQEEELQSTEDEAEARKDKKATSSSRKSASGNSRKRRSLDPSTEHAPSSSSSRKRSKEHDSDGEEMETVGCEEEDSGAEEDEADDECFICGQDNELLQCDFPQCRRVYHQVCIVKRLPQPLMIDNSDDLYSPYSTHMTDFTWFCPKHYCASCGSLEKGEISLKSMALPENLIAQAMQKYQERKNKAVSYLDCISQKTLKNCATCPFAMCTACEDAAIPAADKLQGGESFFRAKRNSEVCQCQNCFHPSPKLQLAKLLEKAWSKMSRSRLALPFLRPMLPIENSTAISCSTNDSAALLEDSDAAKFDLMKVLDKIHQCEYSSLKDFQRDLNTLRNHALEKLEQCLQTFVQPGEDATQLATFKDIQLSLDTILEAAEQFIDSKRLILQNIEDDLNGKETKVGQNDIDDSNSNNNEMGTRRSRKRSAESTENSEEVALLGSGRGNVPEYLCNAFWRVECHFDPTEFKLMRFKDKGLKMFSVFKKVDFNQKALVGARSVQQWAEYVRQGSIPQKYKEGVAAASGMNHLAYGTTARSVASYQNKNPLDAKAVVKRMLDQEDLEGALTDELQVAQLMIGMQHNALRETFTLNQHMDHVLAEPMLGMASSSSAATGPLWSKATEHYHSTRLQDESLLMLERLQDMTKQTLELQARLKQDYLLKQRQVFQTSSEVLSFHDVGLLTELKLGNDNLRWRLKQRNLLIESKNEVIAQLTKQCKDYEARIEELEHAQQVSAASTAPATTLPRIVKTTRNGHSDTGSAVSSSGSTSQTQDIFSEAALPTTLADVAESARSRKRPSSSRGGVAEEQQGPVSKESRRSSGRAASNADLVENKREGDEANKLYAFHRQKN